MAQNQNGQSPLVVVQSTRVYGLDIPNPEAATLTRKVIRMSVLLLMLQVAYSVYNTVALEQGKFVYVSFLSLMVPLCGYYGAKYRNRGLVIAFSMCNCLSAVGIPASLVMLGGVMHFLNKNFDMWCPDGPTGFPKYPNA